MYSDCYHLRIQTLCEQLITLSNMNLPKTSYPLIHVTSKAPCSTPATDSEEEEAAAQHTQRETHLHSHVLHLKSPKGPGESLKFSFLIGSQHWPLRAAVMF